MVNEHRVLSAMSNAAENNSFRLTALVRLAYIPLGLKNVGLSAFPISSFCFCTATLLVNIPYSLCWAWLGSSVLNATDVAKGQLHLPSDWHTKVVLGTAFGFTVLLMLVGAYFSHKFYRYASPVVTADQDPETPRRVIDRNRELDQFP
jgi:uncharacterized membrane protein YdjX (TVP38/TMEM64 family)